MTLLLLLFAATQLLAQSEPGPYARIAVLRPHDGKTVDFEAGYIRHLDWHRQAKDTAAWYGWTIWAGERQRWFVYATFGHSAASLGNPVSPSDDERDNIVNVTPHAEFVSNALYEFLPALSRGSGVPAALPRLELTAVEVTPGKEQQFEAALKAQEQKDETLWYRMVAGGSAPRYVRLRARQDLAAIVALEDALPANVEKLTIEILNLRPTMSYMPAR